MYIYIVHSITYTDFIWWQHINWRQTNYDLENNMALYLRWYHLDLQSTPRNKSRARFYSMDRVLCFEISSIPAPNHHSSSRIRQVLYSLLRLATEFSSERMVSKLNRLPYVNKCNKKEQNNN